ncbi:unnamed protein product [Sphagnum jensenii]|uniref:PGG domain-containing protein n=1 Tax=Sphagnum jensenii TaxID=128206 RepID=A0ABP1A3U5_9BRYO
MMAQNTSEDKEISDSISHETKKSSESVEWISIGASNHCLESYVDKELKDFGLEEPPSQEEDYFDFLRKRGEIYEEALGRARPLEDTRSEAERKEDVKRIEDLLVWKLVNADFDKYGKKLHACGRIECWAARQMFVNIVVALIRPRGPDDPKSVKEGLQATPISKELLALAIAAENNDLKMVRALKDIAVAEESIESREPNMFFLSTTERYCLYNNCDTRVYELYPSHEVWLCPIQAAARLGLDEIVGELIGLREAKRKANIEANTEADLQKIMTFYGEAYMEGMFDGGELRMYKTFLKEKIQHLFSKMKTNEKLNYQRAFSWAVKMGHRQVVDLLINMRYIVDLNAASNVRGLLDNADVKSYGWHQNPLALAVLSANFEMVKFLCGVTNGDLRTDAKNRKGKSAIQIAFNESRYGARAEGHVRYKIWEHIMKRDDSKREVNKLTEERKVHVDAINAILVGTALIATATFAGWLSPPLGYSSLPGTDGPFASVEGHPILESFWVFNSLSFFFSIATFMVGANVALPPPEDIYIGDVVQSLRWKLKLAYGLVSAAVFFVMGAFASAGFAVLPPIPKYTVNMALTVGIGVTVVAVVVFSTFFGHMFTKSSWQQLEHKMKIRWQQFEHMFTKSGWQQLKLKMKVRCWQQSKDEMESSDDD